MFGATKNKLVNVARENIFHIKIQIEKTMVATIFDPGRKNNLISKALVKKLGLKTTIHLNPYPLGWL